MPITENNFTDAELITAIEANPGLEAVIKAGLGTKKFIVQNETEHADFLKNYKDTAYRKNVIDEHTAEFAPKLEKDIKELTGLDKASQDEKYFDYLKRAVGTKLGTVAAMEKELETLKKGHAPSEIDKQRIAQLEAGIQAKEDEWSKKYGEKETELNKVKIGGKIETAFAKVRPRYKADLPASIIKMAEDKIGNDILPFIKVQADGTETIIDDKGEIRLDKTTYKPITVDFAIAELLGDIIDPGKKVTGTGTTKEELDKVETGKFTGLPSTVTTKVGLSSYLKQLGYTEGSKEFDEILAEHGKDLKLR